MTGGRYSLIRRAVFILGMAFFCIFTLAPFVWMVMSSFIVKAQLLSDPFSLPPQVTLDNYSRLFTSENDGVGAHNFIRSVINSLGVCTATTAISLVIGCYIILRPWIEGHF